MVIEHQLPSSQVPAKERCDVRWYASQCSPNRLEYRSVAAHVSTTPVAVPFPSILPTKWRLGTIHPIHEPSVPLLGALVSQNSTTAIVMGHCLAYCASGGVSPQVSQPTNIPMGNNEIDGWSDTYGIQ
jgi:hypothetical protein